MRIDVKATLDDGTEMEWLECRYDKKGYIYLDRRYTLIGFCIWERGSTDILNRPMNIVCGQEVGYSKLGIEVSP